MRQVVLPTGEPVPALGLGTWKMGESAAQRDAEVVAVRNALQLGYRLVDTAEMYGDGGAEQVVGRALSDLLLAGELRRQDVFVVSKVYPHHATRTGLPQACERSLRRLGLESIDLYLLHWRGNVPLVETVAAFERLRAEGRIRHWGVSNFDVDDLQRLWRLKDGAHCAANQVYYSLTRRGVEFDLLPWQRARGLPLMAYSPIDQGALARHPNLGSLAASRGVSAATLALAWLLAQGVVVVAKTVRDAHLRDNLRAAELDLEPTERERLDRLFPPPRSAQPLAVL